MLWDAWEFAEIIKFAKTDAKLMQRIDLVKSYMTSLDPQFDETYWTALAVIPEEQRVICLNDLNDTHSTDKIQADVDIQADIKAMEKQWGFIVRWEPGSEAPPMPVKVRFKYSYFTDKKLPEFKTFLRRTIHHEVLHLIDKEFSKEGGPIYGANWDSLNQKGFHYRVGSPGTPNNPSQLSFYKDNTEWQGFAEPYGMNIATDDRATLFARMMTARVADEGGATCRSLRS